MKKQIVTVISILLLSVNLTYAGFTGADEGLGGRRITSESPMVNVDCEDPIEFIGWRNYESGIILNVSDVPDGGSIQYTQDGNNLTISRNGDIISYSGTQVFGEGSGYGVTYGHVDSLRNNVHTLSQFQFADSLGLASKNWTDTTAEAHNGHDSKAMIANGVSTSIPVSQLTASPTINMGETEASGRITVDNVQGFVNIADVQSTSTIYSDFYNFFNKNKNIDLDKIRKAGADGLINSKPVKEIIDEALVKMSKDPDYENKGFATWDLAGMGSYNDLVTMITSRKFENSEENKKKEQFIISLRGTSGTLKEKLGCPAEDDDLTCSNYTDEGQVCEDSGDTDTCGDKTYTPLSCTCKTELEHALIKTSKRYPSGFFPERGADQKDFRGCSVEFQPMMLSYQSIDKVSGTIKSKTQTMSRRLFFYALNCLCINF